MPVRSLLYHDVVAPGRYAESGFQSPVAHRYKLTTDAFREQLAAVAALELPVLSVHQALRQPQRTSLLLTFDDGGSSFLDPIAGLLEARGWVGHFFITTGQLNTPGFLTGDQVRELHARGHVIGSHSCTHPPQFSALGDVELEREWRTSRELLSALINAPVTTGSVPGGYYSRRVALAAAHAGLDIVFNSEPTESLSRTQGCQVLGRYAVVADTPTPTVAKLAAGDAWTCRKQAWVWNAKKAVKFCLGACYRRLSQQVWKRRSPARVH